MAGWHRIWTMPLEHGVGHQGAWLAGDRLGAVTGAGLDGGEHRRTSGRPPSAVGQYGSGLVATMTAPWSRTAR